MRHRHRRQWASELGAKRLRGTGAGRQPYYIYGRLPAPARGDFGLAPIWAGRRAVSRTRPRLGLWPSPGAHAIADAASGAVCNQPPGQSVSEHAPPGRRILPACPADRSRPAHGKNVGRIAGVGRAGISRAATPTLRAWLASLACGQVGPYSGCRPSPHQSARCDVEFGACRQSYPQHRMRFQNDAPSSVIQDSRCLSTQSLLQTVGKSMPHAG